MPDAYVARVYSCMSGGCVLFFTWGLLGRAFGDNIFVDKQRKHDDDQEREPKPNYIRGVMKARPVGATPDHELVMPAA